MNSGQQIVLHIRDKQRVESAETAIVPDIESSTIRIVWEWWRIAQSEYHSREIGEVDLGDLGEIS